MTDKTILISCNDCGATGSVTDAEDILTWMDAHPCTARRPRRRRSVPVLSVSADSNTTHEGAKG